MEKLQPHAPDFEKAVLGAILIEPHSIDRVLDKLFPDVFYDPKHQDIFKSILQLKKENYPVDIITCAEKLKSVKKLKVVGGPGYITELTSRIGSTANIEYHSAVIYQKYQQRQLIKLGDKMMNQAFNERDGFDIINEAQEAMSKLTGFDIKNVKHVSDVLFELQKTVDRNINNTGELTGIPTGFISFDKHSNGLQLGDLTIIAGETSNGKTALALNIINHASLLGVPSIIYSYEMSDRQLVARMVATSSGISSKDILYNKLNDHQLVKLNDGIGALYEQNLFIDDLENSSYEYLERSIRSMVIKEGIKLVVIDYLQLIRLNSKNLNKVDQVAQIANDLKNLAKTLNISIILISQLSRDKNNPTPTLSRLKGSGDIENAADVIWLVWQPMNYNEYDFECKGETISSKGNSHHIIAKGRNIGTTEFALGFNKPLTTFTNTLN